MSLLSWLQGDLNLNICEAHAFNTKDKFSLDVFVVNGWRGEVRSCTQQAGHSRQELPCQECRARCTSSCTAASRNSWVISSRGRGTCPMRFVRLKQPVPSVGC